MQSNFRNLAIWVVIALLLVALFNLFQNPSQSRSGQSIAYSEFLTAVKSRSVQEVTIRGNRINGVYRDGGSRFTTQAPNDAGLGSEDVESS